jgi:CBS domain-containing protein
MEGIDMKKVANIMTPGVQVIDAYSTVGEAARRMKEFDVGALAVMSADIIVALLTDRDIVVRAVAESRDLNATKIEEIMSGPPIACNIADTIEKAAELLSIHRIHRLLVTDESNQAVGIVSLADVLIEIAAQDSRIVQAVLKNMSDAGMEQPLGTSQAACEAIQQIPVL